MGTDLRPELKSGGICDVALPRAEVLRRIYKSVARRRTLARGKLDDGEQHCALGWANVDCKKNRTSYVMDVAVADEIAAVNDKLGPNVSPKRRWQYVMAWLRKEIASALKTKGDQT
jgi:hypothetical protein